MFQTASGVTIPFPEKIREEFQVFDNSILLNMSFEKITSFVDEFINQLSEPLFFVLELPLSEQEEIELRKDDTYPFHKKICYLDEQSKFQIKEILSNYGELLLNDGISQFAVYSHSSRDGIYIQKYKIISIFSRTPENYIEILEKSSIHQTDNLLTVWDTFSHDAPGEARRVEVNGVDIFSLYDELVKLGMYVATIKES